MKGIIIIKPFSLQTQILDQLHSYHIGIKKMLLLSRDSLYWIKMNADLEHILKQCTMCLDYQQIQPQEKALCYEVPWEVVVTDVFMINNKTSFVL